MLYWPVRPAAFVVFVSAVRELGHNSRLLLIETCVLANEIRSVSGLVLSDTSWRILERFEMSLRTVPTTLSALTLGSATVTVSAFAHEIKFYYSFSSVRGFGVLGFWGFGLGLEFKI